MLWAKCNRGITIQGKQDTSECRRQEIVQCDWKNWFNRGKIYKTKKLTAQLLVDLLSMQHHNRMGFNSLYLQRDHNSGLKLLRTHWCFNAGENVQLPKMKSPVHRVKQFQSLVNKTEQKLVRFFILLSLLPTLFFLLSKEHTVNNKKCLNHAYCFLYCLKHQFYGCIWHECQKVQLDVFSLRFWPCHIEATVLICTLWLPDWNFSSKRAV